MLRTTIRRTPNAVPTTVAALPVRWSTSNPSGPSTSAQDQAPKNDDLSTEDTTPKEPKERNSKSKTMAELDEEMRAKMSGLSGDGGEAGIEYEDGKPVAMKRSVKNNSESLSYILYTLYSMITDAGYSVPLYLAI